MNNFTTKNHTIITACTGSGYAESGRGGSAFLIMNDKTAILLDCGEGTAGWVNHFNLAHKIIAVFISHLHPDHVSGLFALVQNMYLAKRQAPLEIFLPAEGIDSIRNMLAAMYLDSHQKESIFTIQYHPVAPMLLWNGAGLSVRAWQSDHFNKDNKIGSQTPRPAFGFSVEAALKRLVYTADVATIECFTPELHPGSTLISEAAHIDYRAVVRLAFDKQVERLVFTHIEPTAFDDLYEYCRTCHFVTIAGDGLTLEW
jgi:ribonuclease BN (tRNA processing enzyme)